MRVLRSASSMLICDGILPTFPKPYGFNNLGADDSSGALATGSNHWCFLMPVPMLASWLTAIPGCSILTVRLSSLQFQVAESLSSPANTQRT
jgi:hypothetical protein